MSHNVGFRSVISLALPLRFLAIKQKFETKLVEIHFENSIGSDCFLVK